MGVEEKKKDDLRSPPSSTPRPIIETAAFLQRVQADKAYGKNLGKIFVGTSLTRVLKRPSEFFSTYVD